MEIIFEGPSFYGAEDENIFFGIIESLGEFESIVGKGIYLTLKLKEGVSEETAEKLLVLFRRWDIVFEPLQALRNGSNASFALWNEVF